MPDKPKRPWRSFREYATAGLAEIYGRDWFRDHFNQWPCLECKGRGKVVDPSSLGIYEARAEYLPCPKCEKTGLGTKEEHKAVYDLRIQEYLEKKRRYETHLKHFKAAKAKLLPAEVNAIKFFGLK